MNKIKFSFVLTAIAIIITMQLFSQDADSISNNFYSYTNKMDVFYNSLIENTPDTLKIPGLKAYQRQKDFWSTRVFDNDTIRGSYSKYIEQLMLYGQNPSMLPAMNTTNTWEFVGPKNVPSHNQGIIVSLYVAPDNIDNIYAGTNASGLFRTTNGGQNWTNVTESINMPGLGVLDIAVNPANPAVVYISTGNDHNNYGTGIYKTTDGCNSWQQILSFNPNEKMLGRRLLINPQNSLIIYALVNKYVYRTIDGGTNWEVILVHHNNGYLA